MIKDHYIIIQAFATLLTLYYLGTNVLFAGALQAKTRESFHSRSNHLIVYNPFSSSLLAAAANTRRKWSARSNDFGGSSLHHEQEHQRRHRTTLDTDHPTETRTDLIGPPILPSQPTIVVLGASGKIGRLVVRQLLELPMDITVIAFCRDYDKACRVLYDDMLVANRTGKKGGPKLQIVQGDLVPQEELPGGNNAHDEEAVDWFRRAQSAAAFYGTSLSDYDNREDQPEPNEALQDAIRGCTTIISCVGSVRPSNLWTDFLARPLVRILRRDVSNWCRDPRHPFYVHYASTCKVLALAEQEQKRRENALSALADRDDTDLEINNINSSMISKIPAGDHKRKSIPRIRFIRISDLCVSQQPWHFIPLLTNALHSMVFRYQLMAENLLQSNSRIETIILRPGDLIDDERNVTTTALQVSADGTVPSPSRVSREDVAALAVAASLYNVPVTSRRQERHMVSHSLEKASTHTTAPFHYTLAVRWVGEDLSPYPSQGTKDDGLPNAQMCLQSAIRKTQNQNTKASLRRNENRQIEHDLLLPILTAKQSIGGRAAMLPDTVALASSYGRYLSNGATKPYGICVAVPVYLLLTLMIRTIFCQLGSLIIWPMWMRSWWMQTKCTAAFSMATVMGYAGTLMQHAFAKFIVLLKQRGTTHLARQTQFISL